MKHVKQDQIKELADLAGKQRNQKNLIDIEKKHIPYALWYFIMEP